MPDFMERRRLARLVDGSAKRIGDVQRPERGWIATVRHALGMTAEQVARRKGVSRNAVYQAERSELDGGVSINQMQRIAAAMGGRFVYAIVPDARIDELLYQQALKRAKSLLRDEPGVAAWSADDRQDWVEDKAAELLHDNPVDFWDEVQD